MKKLAFILAFITLFMSGCSSADSSAEENSGSDATEEVSEEYKPIENIYGETITIEMKIKDFGTMTIELYPEEAPITVRRFVSLVNEGFYNGLIIHRVVPGFVIQGGDPTGTGFGKDDLETIEGEFYANGIKNRIPHQKGVISMARKLENYNSATTQFFICADTSDAVSVSLDEQYAAFGCVTEGIVVVDLITTVTTTSNDKPYKDVVIESVKVTDTSFSDEELEEFLNGNETAESEETTDDMSGASDETTDDMSGASDEYEETAGDVSSTSEQISESEEISEDMSGIFDEIIPDSDSSQAEEKI